jgi:hypothetical protein
MTEPLSRIVRGGAIGSVTGQFTEDAWDTGQKWLAERFKDHNITAAEKARENAGQFLIELANWVKQLEDSKAVADATIKSAQDDPDFSILLQKAMLSSAQTSDKEKHRVLARLVAERLKANSNSRTAVMTKLACDAIPNLTRIQLHLLGLLAIVYDLNLTTPLDAKQYHQLLMARLTRYVGLDFDFHDLSHLEAVSCLRNSAPAGRDFSANLSARNKGGDFDFDRFSREPTGKSILEMWARWELWSVIPTTTGMLVGIYVSDSVAGVITDCSNLEYRKSQPTPLSVRPHF